MKLQMILFLVPVLTLIIGCSDDNDTNTTLAGNSSSTSSCGFLPTDSTLKASQQQIWEAQQIDDYIFEFHYTRYSYYATDSDFRNKVVDGVCILSESSSSAGSHNVTLDDLFSAASGPISYSEQYGFVTGYHNNDQCAYDAYVYFNLLSFEPLNETNITTEEHMLAQDWKVQNIIKNKSCTQTSECESIAYGSKACGGPLEYLIYSSKEVDINELQPLVDSYNNYAQQYNEETNAISDCMYVTPPELECNQNSCQKVSNGTSSSSNSI